MKILRSPQKLSFTTQNVIPTIGFPKWGSNTNISVSSSKFLQFNFAQILSPKSKGDITWAWNLAACSIQDIFTSHSSGNMSDPHHVTTIESIPVLIWGTVTIYFQLQVSRTKLILRGEGCNGPTLIFILITLNHLNYELITLGPAFQSSIFSFQFSNFLCACILVRLQVESTEWPRNEILITPQIIH